MGIVALLVSLLRAFPVLLSFIERITVEARRTRADTRLVEKDARVDAALDARLSDTRLDDGLHDSSNPQQQRPSHGSP